MKETAVCHSSRSAWFILGMLLAAVGITVWWLQLSEDRQRFYTNILRQIPDMPGRYSV